MHRTTGRLPLLRNGVLAAGVLFAVQALGADCVPVARVVSLQGEVELRRAQTSQWSPAPTEAALCPGDALRVGARSRAALRLANETNLRLDQNTALTLTPDEQASVLEMLRGALNVFTRTPRPFKVRTPFLNAGVEGTEFLVRVTDDAAQVAVFEGRVAADNEQGAIAIGSGEAATASRGSAPRREAFVRPADAVQWSLHYPSVIGADAALREADALARRGRLAEAFARLDAVPAGQRSARHLAYRAELLLAVGRVDEAQMQIERALALDPRSGDARALQAVIAIVRNDVAEALRLANEAVQSDARSAAARIALSYAEQARFDIPAALASAEAAARIAPDSALAWTRVAELRMAGGDLNAALDAAQRAAALDPDLARTQSMLGFAHLTRLDAARARETFQRAIELDQADPLPRLGLGLALIREGKLAPGREQIEIAVTLDPLHSLMRSYLGKAYFEERRNALAGTQFDLAKSLDPRDPTPWFYGAALQQSRNRPVEALRDLDKSIELNDNRAVYRSRLLLDEDLASRGVSVANVYRELGFRALAAQEAAKSLAADSRNAPAHELLSNVFGELPRHGNAADSEELQYRLRQSSIVIPASALRPGDTLLRGEPALGVQVLREAAPLRAAFNEFSSLFDRRRTSAYLDGIAGNQDTHGDQAILTGNYEHWSFSLGQALVSTDGINEDARFRQHAFLGSAYLKPTSGVTFYVEGRESNTDRADVNNPFDPDLISRVELDGKVRGGRVAARVDLGRSSDLIATTARDERELSVAFRDAPPGIGPIRIEEGATSHQLLWSYSARPFGISAGGGRLRGTTTVDANVVQRGEPSFDSLFAYAHAHWRTLSLQAGIASEDYEERQTSPLRVSELSVRKTSPKGGIVWTPTPMTTVRLAASRSIARPDVGGQTIEPTHVAGFSQLQNDVPGSISRRYALGVGQRVARNAYVGVDATRRKIGVPSLDSADETFDLRERTIHGYAYAWLRADRERSILPGLSAAASVDYEYERLNRPEEFPDDGIRYLTTRFVPVRVSLFPFNSTSVQLAATHTRQSGQLQVGAGEAIFDAGSRFWVIDANVLYRLPHHRAAIAVGARNLFDRDLSKFQELDPARPRFAQGRLVFVRLSARF